METKCYTCGGAIEPARIEIGLDRCYTCADRYTQKRTGAMTWTHQTGPELELLSGRQLANRRKYDPINRLW